jgi:hypothetical protein
MGYRRAYAALNDVYENGDFRAHLPIAEECGAPNPALPDLIPLPPAQAGPPGR